MISMKPANLVFVLALAATAFAGPAAAQSQPSEGLAVLDWNRVYKNAKATKDARSQLQVYKNKFQDNIKKEEDALRQANQELARQRSILAPEAFAAERSKFEKKLTAIQRKVQDLNRQLDEAQVNATDQFSRKLTEVTAKVVEERNLLLVLNSAQTVIFASKLDITEEVLKRIDKDLPTIKIILPPLSDSSP